MVSLIRFVCFVTAAILGMETVAGASEPATTRPLEIDFIDVQGGAATLLATPAGESILIDSGWPGFEDRDPKRIVHVLKDLAGYDHLDHLVTTHWHRDHFGGVGALAKMIRIDHFWDRGLPEDRDSLAEEFQDGAKPDDPLFRAYREASSGKRKPLKPGDSLPLAGIKVLVLASGGQVADRQTASRFRPDTALLSRNALCDSAVADKPIDRSENARSLALLFSLGRFQFFDAGDLTWNVEKKLVCPADLVGPVDLYQVTHHGLEDSNHPTLVQTIAPVVAIMNNGPQKGGSPATVKLLKSVPSIQAAYQLHKNAATSDLDNTDPALIANRDASGGEFIRVRGVPDGSKFTVQIGDHGPLRTFESR
jgi:beta-lactamase superfamily II metal-dependent hydrolase